MNKKTTMLSKKLLFIKTKEVFNVYMKENSTLGYYLNNDVNNELILEKDWGIRGKDWIFKGDLYDKRKK